MTDRPRSFTSSSSSSFNLPRRRSHSYREKTTRTANDLHHQKIERIQRHFEQELDKSQPVLSWTKNQRSDSFSSLREYLRNVRTKIKNDYNQLMQEKVEEVEDYMKQRYDEERRLSQRKLRKTQIASEKFRLQSIHQIVRERDAICEEKLIAQRSLYNHLLDEQTRRVHAERNLQSFENLNIEQLKDRLTRVEDSNHELKQLIRNLIYRQRQRIYKNSIYIPNFAC